MLFRIAVGVDSDSSNNHIHCLNKDPNLPEYYELFMCKQVLMCPGVANVFVFRFR